MRSVIAVLVLVLVSCAPISERAEEVGLVGRVGEGVASVAQDPTTATMVREGIKLATTLFYVLTGLGTVGAVGGGGTILVRNHRSNKRKAAIEKSVSDLEREMMYAKAAIQGIERKPKSA